jgi:hypothetical protein
VSASLIFPSLCLVEKLLSRSRALVKVESFCQGRKLLWRSKALVKIESSCQGRIDGDSGPSGLRQRPSAAHYFFNDAPPKVESSCQGRKLVSRPKALVKVESSFSKSIAPGARRENWTKMCTATMTSKI